MAKKKKKLLEMKYGFPNFTRECNSISLCNSQKLIISDIWSFWDYIIKKNNFDKTFMNSLLEQAKFFYITAEKSPVKSQPLLYYYSFLNFVKIIINIEHSYGRNDCKYLHGVKQNGSTKFAKATIKISKKKNYIKNVSAEFIDVIDQYSIKSDMELNVKKLLIHCVGIHRTYSEIYNQHEKFCRLDDMKLYKYGKKLIFESKVQCNSDEYDQLLLRGYNILNENNKYIWKETYCLPANYVTRKDYYKFSKELKNKGIWYYIGNKGYVNYISTNEEDRISPEFIIYNTMFYLGSITRYYPYLFDKIFSANEQWLMSEFLSTQPKQFLFSTTAKILSQKVLKAYADF